MKGLVGGLMMAVVIAAGVVGAELFLNWYSKPKAP